MKKREFTKDILIFLSLLLNSLSYFFSGFFQRRENYVVCGAWKGERYSDNPRFLLEYLQEDPTLELFWVGEESLRDLEIFQKPHIHFLKRNSIQAYGTLLRAKYAYFSNSYRDLGYLNLLRGATITQLWHGFGLKNTLSARKDMSRIKQLYYKIGKRSYERYDYFISSSPYNTKKILKTFRDNGIHKKKVIKSGQPKNDFLIHGVQGDGVRFKEAFHQKYGIPLDKKIISYLPTFRDHEPTFQFIRLERGEKEALIDLLRRENAVLLEKLHMADTTHYQGDKSKDSSILHIDPREDSSELLLASDVLITDYSSCYLDFTLLDRPILHFAYDLEGYRRKDRGLYYSLEDYHAGPILGDVHSLLVALEENLRGDPYAQQRRRIRESLMEYEQGHSCRIIKKRTMNQPSQEETRV